MKVYNAYKAAVEHKGGPTVILAKTMKGYGMGAAGEGRNATHQQKKLKDESCEYFRTRFEIPIPDEAVARRCVLSPAGFESRNRLHARAAAGSGRISARRASPRRPDQSSRPPELLDEFRGGSKSRILPAPWRSCACWAS